MDEHNKEFEDFLRQFTLREAAPLPEVVEPERNWMSWFVPARRWVLAAACVVLAVGVSFVALRKSGRNGGPIETVADEKKGTNGTEVARGNGGPSVTPSNGTSPRGNGSEPVSNGTAGGDGVRVERVAVRQGALKIADDLGGPDRFLTHIATDKPIYRAGESVYLRGVILRADGHTPLAATVQSPAHIEIRGPKGEMLVSVDSRIIDSTASLVWTIPDGQAGGEYTIRISHPATGAAPAERKFDIRSYRAPRLKSQIVFVRDGYGPGDTVSASVHVERAEGGIPAGAKVSVSARVDGVEVWKGETAVDLFGNAGASFKLPAVIARGEGSIAMTIQDGGAVETAGKTIPILLQTVDLNIYPEGGDLVAGLLNRVYVEGRTPSQKPADIAGIIVNAAGRQVASFRTEHEGRGRFSFTPARGESYSLRVTEPAGIKTIFPLPEVKASGVVISSTSDVTPRQRNVVLRVAATADGAYDVVLSQRGKEVAFTSVNLKAGQPADVTLTAPRSLDGVIAATVYDSQSRPLAERLLFRQPDRRLNVRVSADRTGYVPGDPVTLRVATTDEAGKPVGAVVGLTVTDSSVLEMIEKREQAPQLPVMVFFESDVRTLSDAHIYLDESNPKAPRATDLLLGTQGWRRFATVDPTKFVVTYGAQARRALAIRIPPTPSGIRTTLVSPSNNGTAVPQAALGTLTGVVLDVTNAPLPGVTVRVTNDDTGISNTTLTNDNGAFLFILSPGANYRITTDMTGFKKLEAKGISLQAANSRRVDVVMEVGAVNQTAAVDAKKADPFLREPNVFNALDEAQLRNLPLVGNDPLALITTLPGYRANPLGHEFDTIGGLPMNMMNTVRDGLSVTDGFKALAAAGTIRLNRLALPPWEDPIRVYAHNRSSNWVEGSRTDFAETVYWNAGITTDAATGIATVSFNLSDLVTSFRVLADGFAANGALGSGVGSVESVRAFYIEPKLPLQVTSGDVIRLPVGMVNGMSRELSAAEVTLQARDGLRVTFPSNNGTALAANERARRLLQIDVANNYSGAANLTFAGKAGAYTDTVSRELDVQPRGFPHETSKGGVLKSNGSQSFEITLPAETIPGSVASSVVVYPTPLASMTQALQALIREPYGCFEQTSSTSYPMVMAQQYFLTHSGVEPAIIEKTRGFLDSAYKKLIGFGSRSGGYEWFGGDPGHEALTAYGLMQFTDMALVREVDSAMLRRTREWLLARRDGDGGFNRNTKSVDSFGGAPRDTTNAYITWALVESGEKGLDREIAAIKSLGNSSEDSYIVALAANVLHASGDRAGARQLMDKLARAQDKAGDVKNIVTSITRSGGEGLVIEGTALSVLAWMREPAYTENVESGIRWIAESNKNGRFASTQATVLALRAIVAYDAGRARPKAPGRLTLVVDGKSVGSPIAFTVDTKGAIELAEFANELAPGKHTIVFKMDDGSDMPFSMNVRYHTDRPENSERAQVGVQVALRNQQVREGAITEAMVSIVNKSNEVIPTPVAIIGIPGGLEVRHDQLKELVKSGKIAAYEVIGREVVLYWRYLKANDKFDLPLSLVAAVPGTYTGPASRAYLYYTAEHKNWSPGLKVTIVP